MRKLQKNSKEHAMTSSERIIITLIWILTVPGIFFMLRRAWRRHQARPPDKEKD